MTIERNGCKESNLEIGRTVCLLASFTPLENFTALVSPYITLLFAVYQKIINLACLLTFELRKKHLYIPVLR